MSATKQSVLNRQWSAAEEARLAEQDRHAPHVLMRPRVFPDGDKWCALYGDNLQEGVAGFGDTPEMACAAFDIAWFDQRTPEAERRTRVEDRRGEGWNGVGA